MPGGPTHTTVLVLEPDDDCRQMLVRMLHRHNVAVLQADSASGALDLYYHFGPSLVVTELNLPLKEGVRFIERIKTARKPSSPSILVLTTETAEVARQRALAAGCDLYISKPFSLAAFYQAIRELLRRETKWIPGIPQAPVPLWPSAPSA